MKIADDKIVLTKDDSESILTVIDKMWDALEDKSRFCCGFFDPVHELRALLKEVQQNG